VPPVSRLYLQIRFCTSSFTSLPPVSLLYIQFRFCASSFAYEYKVR
jgi:hypothetical protein